MLGHAVERAIGEGFREVHFLRGREPYKYAWGAVDLPMYWPTAVAGLPSPPEFERTRVGVIGEASAWRSLQIFLISASQQGR